MKNNDHYCQHCHKQFKVEPPPICIYEEQDFCSNECWQEHLDKVYVYVKQYRLDVPIKDLVAAAYRLGRYYPKDIK